MAWDIAINLQTGDLMWTGTNDFASRDGTDLDKQRIHVRLFIERGEFIYDPSNGALGSRLLDILHLPRARALAEADLYVREALEPMEDIAVTEVGIEELSDSRTIRLKVGFQPRFDSSELSLTLGETPQEVFFIDVPA